MFMFMFLCFLMLISTSSRTRDSKEFIQILTEEQLKLIPVPYHLKCKAYIYYIYFN